MSKWKEKYAIALMAIVLYACGGGNSIVSTADEIFDVGVIFGDSGKLVVKNDGSYTLTIQNSSFGLSGENRSGKIIQNSDGSYDATDNVNQSQTSKLFRTDGFDVMSIPLDGNRINNIYGGTVWVPVVSLSKKAIIRNANLIVRDSTNVVSIEMGYDPQDSRWGGWFTSGAAGVITALDAQTLSIDMCADHGDAANEQNVHDHVTSNAVCNFPMQVNLTFDNNKSLWVGSTNDGLMINASFVRVPIKQGDSAVIVGYIDYSDATNGKSKFQLVKISSIATPAHAGTYNLISYQACSNYSGNCVGPSGVYKGTIHDNSVSQIRANCIATRTNDYPAVGMSATIMTGSGCNAYDISSNSIGFWVTPEMSFTVGYHSGPDENGVKFSAIYLTPQ